MKGYKPSNHNETNDEIESSDSEIESPLTNPNHSNNAYIQTSEFKTPSLSNPCRLWDSNTPTGHTATYDCKESLNFEVESLSSSNCVNIQTSELHLYLVRSR